MRDGQGLNPSLLRFLNDRLGEDWLIAENARARQEVGFAEHFNPPAMIGQARSDREIVRACVEAMQRRPDQPPAPAKATHDPADPVTALASQVLKLMAARYEQHPDYQPDWVLP